MTPLSFLHARQPRSGGGRDDLGAARGYVVEGKTNLLDRSWGPTNESTRFYRVKVSMP